MFSHERSDKESSERLANRTVWTSRRTSRTDMTWGQAKINIIGEKCELLSCSPKNVQGTRGAVPISHAHVDYVQNRRGCRQKPCRSRKPAYEGSCIPTRTKAGVDEPDFDPVRKRKRSQLQATMYSRYRVGGTCQRKAPVFLFYMSKY
jgi:hypothetical protein